jgi:hypothetical protein
MRDATTEIRGEPLSKLREYVSVSNAFEANFILDVVGMPDDLSLRERRLDRLYYKDYDLVENPLQRPIYPPSPRVASTCGSQAAGWNLTWPAEPNQVVRHFHHGPGVELAVFQ